MAVDYISLDIYMTQPNGPISCFFPRRKKSAKLLPCVFVIVAFVLLSVDNLNLSLLCDRGEDLNLSSLQVRLRTKLTNTCNLAKVATSTVNGHHSSSDIPSTIPGLAKGDNSTMKLQPNEGKHVVQTPPDVGITLEQEMTNHNHIHSRHPHHREFGNGKHGRPISVVVQLSGEMGNNLHKIAFGRALQNMIWERYQMGTVLVLQHQEKGGKWVSAMQNIQRCFPNLRTYDFELGNQPEFVRRRHQQRDWLRFVMNSTSSSRLEIPNGADDTYIDQTLDYLYRIVTSNRTQLPLLETNATITFPFLYSQAFVGYAYIDRFYDDFQRFFAFDNEECCEHVPYADESVFVRLFGRRAGGLHILWDGCGVTASTVFSSVL